jgi:hypothetical protein
MRRQSFERFYLEKVAVGEGCGCAEQAIGMRDMDSRSRNRALQGKEPSSPDRRWSWLKRLIQRGKVTP